MAATHAEQRSSLYCPFRVCFFSWGVPPHLVVALCGHHPRRCVIRPPSQQVDYFCTIFFILLPCPVDTTTLPLQGGVAAWTIIFFSSCDLIIEEEHNPQPITWSPQAQPHGGGGSVNPGRCMSVHLALMACRNFKSFCVLFFATIQAEWQHYHSD